MEWNQPSASRILVSVDSSWLYGLRSDEPLRFPFAHARLNSLWNCDVDTAIPTLLCGLPRVEWNRQGYMGCFLSNERVDLCHISLEFYSSFQSHGSNPFRLAADRAFHFGLSGVVWGRLDLFLALIPFSSNERVTYSGSWLSSFLYSSLVSTIFGGWVFILDEIVARVTMMSIVSMGSAHICCYPLLNHIGCSLHGCNGMTETFTFQLYRVH